MRCCTPTKVIKSWVFSPSTNGCSIAILLTEQAFALIRGPSVFGSSNTEIYWTAASQT
jgi:hypothetical protein